ncbi:hypothetical protein VCHE48_0327 [Vibrio cholerae HE48]|nr:hypothetical protein VCHE48_0327 [Vibrio cholerae HE48]BCN22013.1 hypothetical protein [Vibrio cholerae]HBC3477454.1 hypothetical protein [Vibrio cholerae]
MVFSRPNSSFHPEITIGNKLIHKLQRHWYIWPEDSLDEPTVAPKARRWDKVIGLVPQSVCLFKVFYYQTDLIPQSQIRQCVANELEQLIDWPEYQSHIWINKIQERWQVSVWFWDKSRITFAQPVTHIVPAIAYQLARVKTSEGILLHIEGEAPNEQSWAITWQNGKVIEQLHPMQSLLHMRSIANRVRENQYVYTNQTEYPLIQDVTLTDFSCTPSSFVLLEGKCSNQFDFDNPWQYWRQILVLLFFLMIYIAADALLVNFKQSDITEQITQLQQETFQIQRLRGEAQDTQRVLMEIELARFRQYIPAKLIDALTKNLAQDVIIDRLMYKPERLVLQGTIKDSLGLLETLSALNGVKEARLLGEVLPTTDGRQEFRAELILLEVGKWND